MRFSGLWPDLASLGFGLLAVALGAWYVVANQFERQRRYREDKRSLGTAYSGPGLHPGQPVEPASFDDTLAELLAQTGEPEEPTGAEEILTASPGPVAGGLFGASADLLAGTIRVTGAIAGSNSLPPPASCCS